MKWLALDLGSTGTKCALLEDGAALLVKTAPTPPNTARDPLRYEVDMEAYLQQIRGVLSAMPREGASGLLLSTQMHGYVLADEDFRPCSPFVTWQDRLASGYLDRFARRLGKDAASPSGVPLKANLALCALMARMEDGYGLPENARFCTLGGFVLGALCGTHVCHMTNAAPTGLADVRRGTWNRLLIEAAGLAGLGFPRIETGLSPVGTFEGLPVYPDLGDQQAGAYGADLQTDTSLHISIGTAGLMGALTKEWGGGPYENRPWIEPGRYLRTVSGLPGGRQLRQLHDWVTRLMRAVGGEAPEEDTVWAWLNGVEAGPEPQQPAGLLDLLAREPEQAVLAVYEAMAREYARAADSLRLPIRRLTFSGGGAMRSAALRTMIARAMGIGEEPGVCGSMTGMIALAKKLEETV